MSPTVAGRIDPPIGAGRGRGMAPGPAYGSGPGPASLDEQLWSLIQDLRAYRQRMRWTQVEVAEAMGTNPTYLCHVEIGRYPATPRLVARYAEVCGLTLGLALVPAE